MSDQYTPIHATVQVGHFPSMAYAERRDLPTIPALYFVVEGEEFDKYLAMWEARVDLYYAKQAQGKVE